MKPDTNTMSTDHNSDVLKIFGIDSNIGSILKLEGKYILLQFSYI